MESRSDCPFCGIAGSQTPAVVLCEDDETVAFMDVRPAAQGHSLVIPRAHFVNVLDIPERLVRSCAVTTQKVAGAIHKALSADGIRVNQYNGRAAGQTVFHYHVHVIPVASGRRAPAHGRDLADPASLENVARRIRRYL